ncbi:MAG TPA: rhomboid family intramembrane serine protease [Polyangiaceae bacterium]|nr:rhomboid family intramembrane serine protease [Polyangiaceae bacterium]
MGAAIAGPTVLTPPAMSFGFTEVVLLICAGLWLLHAVQLARLPFRRTWPSFVIVTFGVGTTLAVWWLAPRWAAAVAAGLVLVLLMMPAVLTRAASRALRWGHIDRARTLAWFAFVLRPIAAQRRFRRAVDVSWRLGTGEDVDLDEVVESLGPLTRPERRAYRVAFLSWSNDLSRMAEELSDPKVRALAMRAGMAAITTTVVGETSSDAGLLAHWLRLKKVPELGGGSIDSTWALVLMAAYFGDVALVAEMNDVLKHDIPPDRRAFALATAQQRAGQLEDAVTTVQTAMEGGISVPSSLARLKYRLDHPRPPLREVPATAPAREEIARRLRARRALDGLRRALRRPAPLTSAIAVFLCGVFAWQTTQTRKTVFGLFGLLSPYAEYPDPYRLLSYACVHLDVGHLLVNVLGLLVFGGFVERAFGVARYALIYFVGAAGGGAAYLFFAGDERGVAIGASGAVFAVVAATVLRLGLDGEVRASQEGRRMLTLLAGIVALQFVVDALWAQSSGSAHAGGLVAGLVMALVLLPRPVP